MVEPMTYTVRAARFGGRWTLTVSELPGVSAQVRRVNQAEMAVRKAIAAVLAVPEDAFEVTVDPDVPDVLRYALRLRAQAESASLLADRATLDAVRALTKEGYSGRELGCLLGLSPQRISQLAQSMRG